MRRAHPTGMTAFSILWSGQVLSLIGSAVTGWSLGVWAYKQTGQATTYALIGLSFMVPLLLLSPIAGAMVDRYNRKAVLAISDLASGVASLAILLLYLGGNLQVWHLYVAGVLMGTGQAFQFPAYSAAISTLIPKAQLGRANGMVSLADAGSGVLGPILGAALVHSVGLGMVLVIDLVTFAIALGALLAVHIPQPTRSAVGDGARGSLLKESFFGLRYIFTVPSLLGLQLMFLMTNLTATMTNTLRAPFLLDRATESVQSMVLSIHALGGVAGGLLLAAWGGPKRRIHGVLGGMFLTCLLGDFLFGISHTFYFWAGAAFMQAVMVSLLNGSNQAIWQSKVPTDIQGRVFAARRMIAWSVAPLSLLVTGPLVDRVLEPGMAQGGALAGTFGWIFGTGMGSGKGLLIASAGLLGAMMALTGYLFRPVREVESILPDHDQQPAAG